MILNLKGIFCTHLLLDSASWRLVLFVIFGCLNAMTSSINSFIFFSLVVAFSPVRLVNGTTNNSCSGRVEVYLYDQWGTICDHGWDLNDAQVVCRQLGCGRVLSAPRGATFGPGQGSTGLDYAHCTGHESELTQCERPSRHSRSLPPYCGRQENAGVVCEGNTFIHLTYYLLCLLLI